MEVQGNGPTDGGEFDAANTRRLLADGEEDTPAHVETAWRLVFVNSTPSEQCGEVRFAFDRAPGLASIARALDHPGPVGRSLNSTSLGLFTLFRAFVCGLHHLVSPSMPPPHDFQQLFQAGMLKEVPTH